MFVTDYVSLCQLCGFLVSFIHPIHICAVFCLLWVSFSAELWANLRQVYENKIPKAQLSLLRCLSTPVHSPCPNGHLADWLGTAVCCWSGRDPWALSFFVLLHHVQLQVQVQSGYCWEECTNRNLLLGFVLSMGREMAASVYLYWGFAVELVVSLEQGLALCSLLCWPILSTGKRLTLCFI